MKRTIQNKNLFNESDSDFNHSTIDILNITGTIDLSLANITGITTDDVTEATNQYFTDGRVSANSDVSANTSHRSNTSNPHSVIASQIGITDVGSTQIITGAERTQITTNQTDIATAQSDIDGFDDELKNLTSAEIQQLQNIGVETVSNTQWGYVGNMNQSLTTSDNPTFSSINVDTIAEKTLANGVSVDGVVIKDGQVDGVDVSALDTSVGTNTSNIGTNTSNIGTNTSNIGTNTSNIGTNTSNIGTNTSNIGTNTNDIATLVSDVDGFDDELKNLTTSEIQQLQNIDLETVSSAQWGYLGSMDQGVSTGDNIQVSDITSTGIIYTDTIQEKTSLAGIQFGIGGASSVDMSGNFLGNSLVAGSVTASTQLKADTINEVTTNVGVTIDSVLLKDGNVDGRDVSADGTQLDTNTSNISTNTSNIGTNTSDIADRVVGPASSVDNYIVRYNGTTGKIVQDSKILINDDGDILPLATQAQEIGSQSKCFSKLFLDDSAGLSNVIITNNTSHSSITGSENTLVGRSAGASISSAINNTVFGSIAGQTITSGHYNTIIGRGADVTTGTHTNQLALGYASKTDASNQCNIGNSSLSVIRAGGDNVCDLGTSGRQFKDLYLAGQIYGDVGYIMDVQQSKGSGTGTINITTTVTDIATPQFSVTIDDYTTEVVKFEGVLRFYTGATKRFVQLFLKRGTTSIADFTSSMDYYAAANTYLNLPFLIYDEVTSNATYTYKMSVKVSSGTCTLQQQYCVCNLTKLYMPNRTFNTEIWSL